MRILFDQGVPVAIRTALHGHFVLTANEQRWSNLSNGELLIAAEAEGLDVFLTTDTNLPSQQNLKGRKLAVVILTKNRWLLIKPRLAEIAAAVLSAKPGEYSLVEIPSR
jgi:predicted nuclease of predicted toxin-antitoxin system